mgnify:CR=1 FL=1
MGGRGPKANLAVAVAVQPTLPPDGRVEGLAPSSKRALPGAQKQRVTTHEVVALFSFSDRFLTKHGKFV